MNDCIFCKIARGEIPSDKIYEDDLVVAFNDLHPQAPVHVLIVRRNHFSGLNETGNMSEEPVDALVGHRCTRGQKAGAGQVRLSDCIQLWARRLPVRPAFAYPSAGRNEAVRAYGVSVRGES